MKCIACNNPFLYFLERRTEFSLGGAVIDPVYSICRRCGLVSKSPLPDALEVKEYYEKAWQTEEPRPHAHLEAAADFLALNVSPYLAEKKLDRALDVGTKNHAFLDEIDKRLRLLVKHTQDPQPRSRGLKAWTGSSPTRQDSDDPAKPAYTSSWWTGDGYDLVVSTHVLEHVVDPASFLFDLCTYAVGGGIVYIEVPALEGAGRFETENVHKAHLWHFSMQSLLLLCSAPELQEIGVHVIAAKTDLLGGTSLSSPVHRVLLRVSDWLSKEHAHTRFFRAQTCAQDRAYEKAAKKISEKDPNTTALYGACEALLKICAFAAGGSEFCERFDITKYIVVDKFKPRFLGGLCHKEIPDGIQEALVCTRNWNSWVEIKRELAQSHPGVKVSSVFFEEA